jgi:hypothetical protein
VALVAATGCLAAVAYAATRPAAGLSPASRRALPRVSRPPRPRIARHPAATTLSTSASFRLVDRQPRAGFECRLDGEKWHRCEPRVGYRGLAVGAHAFSARARVGARASVPARFAWKQTQPVAFAIEQRPGLGPLYPGAPPQPVPLLLTNPNPEPIHIVDLRISIPFDPPGCSSAENLELRPSTASVAQPIEVPAGSSIGLPAQGPAPTIAMRDLSVSQDACRSARFPLAFSGGAYG